MVIFFVLPPIKHALFCCISVTLEDVYLQHCAQTGVDRHAAMIAMRGAVVQEALRQRRETFLRQIHEKEEEETSIQKSNGDEGNEPIGGKTKMKTKEEEEKNKNKKKKKKTDNGGEGHNFDVETMNGIRLAAYLRLCEELVPDTVLSQYMHESSTSISNYMAVRSHFTRQLALSSFLSYLLSIQRCNPGRLVFHVQSGTVVDNEFRPCYRESHQVKDLGLLQPTEEELPFRLVRSTYHFPFFFSFFFFSFCFHVPRPHLHICLSTSFYLSLYLSLTNRDVFLGCFFFFFGLFVFCRFWFFFFNWDFVLSDESIMSRHETLYVTSHHLESTDCSSIQSPPPQMPWCHEERSWNSTCDCL